jgi:hypothetical protein
MIGMSLVPYRSLAATASGQFRHGLGVQLMAPHCGPRAARPASRSGCAGGALGPMMVAIAIASPHEARSPKAEDPMSRSRSRPEQKHSGHRPGAANTGAKIPLIPEKISLFSLRGHYNYGCLRPGLSLPCEPVGASEKSRGREFVSLASQLPPHAYEAWNTGR